MDEVLVSRNPPEMGGEKELTAMKGLTAIKEKKKCKLIKENSSTTEMSLDSWLD